MVKTTKVVSNNQPKKAKRVAPEWGNVWVANPKTGFLTLLKDLRNSNG